MAADKNRVEAADKKNGKWSPHNHTNGSSEKHDQCFWAKLQDFIQVDAERQQNKTGRQKIFLGD